MKGFVLELTYLTGRSIATAYNNRDRAEWPPHPARVYSALVAAWVDTEERDPDERAALEWLARLDAPSIYAPEATHRQVVQHFVPVNDVSVLDAFGRQRAKLTELRLALHKAKSTYEGAMQSGPEKAIASARKSLTKAEKAYGVAHQRMRSQLIADQQAFAPGQHPETALQSARSMIPEYRNKQPRNFPSVSPHGERVFLCWSGHEQEIAKHGSPLHAVASRVVRVGHSASLVACRVVDECPTPNWHPHDSGPEVLRVPGERQLTQLEDAYALHKGIEPRVLPCRFVRYARLSAGVSSRLAGRTSFDDEWVVFRQIGGRRLSQTCCVELSRAMRGALMRFADAPPSESLSGHTAEGNASQKPHLAIIPLPFVGHPHATGDLLGLALVFPRDTSKADREAILRAIGRWEQAQRLATKDELVDTPALKVTLGRAGVVELERVEWGISPLKTLRPATWCGPAQAWATATPIALDRNPGDLGSRNTEKARAAYEAAEHSIKVACERLGLPTPCYVQVHPSVPINGAAKARAFPPFPADANKHRRVKVHARIEFSGSVAGPVVLGAGRYHGLGLCLPLPQQMSATA